MAFLFLLESKLRMSSTLLLCLKGRRKPDKTESLTGSSISRIPYYIHVSTHSSPPSLQKLQEFLDVPNFNDVPHVPVETPEFGNLPEFGQKLEHYCLWPIGFSLRVKY